MHMNTHGMTSLCAIKFIRPAGALAFARVVTLILAAFITMPGCTQQRPLEIIRTSGDQRFRSGDYLGARDEYAEIVAREPGDWRAQHRLGLSMIETQQYSEARRALEQAYTVLSTRSPSSADSQEVAEALARAMFLQKDEARLFAFLRERATTTRATEAYLELGRYAMELNDPDSAQVALDTAIEVDAAKTTEPYLDAAKLEERLGHLERAVYRLKQAIGINPYDRRVHEMLRQLGEDPNRVKPLPPGREISA